jgi:MFS transporter, putative metabolite:H+ symporter
MHFDRQTGRGAVVPLPEIPTAFLYLRCWFLMAGVVYDFFGMETKGKSIAQIDRELAPA